MDVDRGSKKRIAIFGIKYFPSRGGTSRVVEALLHHLKDDFHLTIYCYEHPDARNNIPGIETICFPVPKIKNIGVFIYFTKCIFHLLFKGRFDLVHAHKTEAAFFAPLIRLRYPVIVTSHEIPHLNDKWSWFGKLYFHLAERIFMYSGATRTSISKVQSEYYFRKYQRHVIHIPNALNKPQVAPENTLNEFLEKQRITGSFLFFAARRIIPLKGLHHLLKALHQINYHGKLVVAGDLSQMESYTREILDSSKGLDVTFTGYIESAPLLNALIRKSELFIFPSEIEGMSVMLMEAAFLGAHIIASDIPPNRAIFDESQMLFFRSKDPQDLGKKLQFSLSNPILLENYSNTAKIHIEANYSMNRIAGMYKDLYHQHLKTQYIHEFTQL